MKIIENQREKSICKIVKNDKAIGTGFLCYVEELKKIKTLITAFHVLGEKELIIGNEIQITFNDDYDDIIILKIEGPRYIYASKKEDITIIEILDNDNLQNYNFLEIEENIYDNYIDFYDEYNNKRIYILHYPEGKLANFSDNIIIDIDNDNNIYHFCSTDGGSSGAPILNLDTLKVIGVHQGYNYFEKEIFHNITFTNYQNNFIQNKIKCNMGKLLKESTYNFNKQNEINLNLKINKDDIGNEIYFLQNYDYMKNNIDIKNIEQHKLNINNFVILINDKIYESKQYFKPKTEGIYHIKILIKNNIKDCFGLFYSCSTILSIDLSSFNSKNVGNMSYMFYDCRRLKKLIYHLLILKMLLI